MLSRLRSAGAAAELEITARALRGADDLVAIVDDHVGRAVGLDHALDRPGEPAAGPGGSLPVPAQGLDQLARVRDRELRQVLQPVLATDEEAALLVDRREQPAVLADVLRGPEEQVAIRQERVVEDRDQLLLQRRVHVDQEVAAGDQVEARERRVPDDVVMSEHAALAQRAADPIGAILPDEELLQALGRDVVLDRQGIAPVARQLQRGNVDVAGEDLEFGHDPGSRHPFAQRDGDRVGLFPGGATGDPNPHAVRGAAPFLEQLWQDALGKGPERVGVAEELGDPDQQIPEQALGLLFAAGQLLEVVPDVVGLQHLHAPLDAPHQGPLLVLAEVVPGARDAGSGRSGSDRRR